MEPEISRRCPACGAAFRVRAAFCPNCGRPTGSAAFDTMAVAEASETQEQQQQQHATGGDKLMETTLPPLSATTSEPDSGLRDEKESLTAEAAREDRPRAITFVEPGATDRAQPKRHRVRTAAREAVEENLKPRVERLRQASTVVLDEATYDPSLRFVLIALALFFIFLVILLANNILG